MNITPGLVMGTGGAERETARSGMAMSDLDLSRLVVTTPARLEGLVFPLSLTEVVASTWTTA